MSARPIDMDVIELAALLDAEERDLLLELFAIASAVDAVEDVADDYTPFVYPH